MASDAEIATIAPSVGDVDESQPCVEKNVADGVGKTDEEEEQYEDDPDHNMDDGEHDKDTAEQLGEAPSLASLQKGDTEGDEEDSDCWDEEEMPVPDASVLKSTLIGDLAGVKREEVGNVENVNDLKQAFGNLTTNPTVSTARRGVTRACMIALRQCVRLRCATMNAGAPTTDVLALPENVARDMIEFAALNLEEERVDDYLRRYRLVTGMVDMELVMAAIESNTPIMTASEWKVLEAKVAKAAMGGAHRRRNRTTTAIVQDKPMSSPSNAILSEVTGKTPSQRELLEREGGLVAPPAAPRASVISSKPGGGSNGGVSSVKLLPSAMALQPDKHASIQPTAKVHAGAAEGIDSRMASINFKDTAAKVAFRLQREYLTRYNAYRSLSRSEKLMVRDFIRGLRRLGFGTATQATLLGGLGLDPEDGRAIITLPQFVSLFAGMFEDDVRQIALRAKSQRARQNISKIPGHR